MSATGGTAAPAGSLSASLIRGGIEYPIRDVTPYPLEVAGFDTIRRWGAAQRGLPSVVNHWRTDNWFRLLNGAKKVLAARKLGIPTLNGQLWVSVLRANGDVEDYGLASLRVVTTAGVNYIVDAFQNLTELENMKYHGVGTGTTAEATSDAALVTESTTALNPDNTRATGSLTEGGTANVFRTVGTNTFDASAAITEHGIFSQAAVPGGVLLDRSVFAAINVATGDSIQTTYDFTVTAGS
jgi:hypothetical protein